MSEKFPTLYKIGGRDQILQWDIEVFDELSDGAKIMISRGQLGGVITESFNQITKGKNIGKANETTPYGQALLEAESRWKKQKDKAYRETVEDAEEAAKAATKPMLAHKFDDKKHTLEEGEKLSVQPKLDGMRCLARKDRDGQVALTSRGGKPINSVPHIVAELEEIMDIGDTWDGELYSHHLDFETMMSIAKKKKPEERHKQLQFHIFDVVSDDTFEVREEELERIHEVTLDADTQYVYAVSASEIEVTEDFEESLPDLLESYENLGYEGVILRRRDVPYEHKRSKQLLKVKSFHDEEFRIVGWEDGKAGSTKADLLQTFVLAADDTVNPANDPWWWEELPEDEKAKLLDEHKVFKGSCFGKEDLLRGMWERRHEYAGELGTVVYQEKTKYDIPRFPKVKAIRDKEDLCK